MTAQNIVNEEEKKVATACGTACGAGDSATKEEPTEVKPTEAKPTACGTGCGATESESKEEPTKEIPKAGSTACGAGE